MSIVHWITSTNNIYRYEVKHDSKVQDTINQTDALSFYPVENPKQGLKSDCEPEAKTLHINVSSEFSPGLGE